MPVLRAGEELLTREAKGEHDPGLGQDGQNPWSWYWGRQWPPACGGDSQRSLWLFGAGSGERVCCPCRGRVAGYLGPWVLPICSHLFCRCLQGTVLCRALVEVGIRSGL